MSLKNMLRSVTPPAFILLAKRLRGNLPSTVYGLSGDYHSWEEAIAASTGYESKKILEKTRVALMKVKQGDAAYERDSVIFDEIQYAWPLLAGLMWVAAGHGGVLNVLDYGGSLGSTYFQNRIFLSTLPIVHWNIVEQSRHVEIGKKWFEDDRLHFYLNIADCLADTQPNVVVLSSVLQYLEKPYKILEQILRLPCDCVIIDRTPFWAGKMDRLCVQTVTPTIYPASYPSWIFSSERFRSHITAKWEIDAEFDGFDRMSAPVEATWKGMIASRQKESINHG